MGFIEKLTKGFIRSSVNQVGRDAGRVISNNLFGSAHSFPVRTTSKQSHSRKVFTLRDEGIIYLKGANGSVLQVNEEDITEDFIRSNFYKMPIYRTRFWGIVFKSIGTVILPVIGPLWWLKKSYDSFMVSDIVYRASEILPFYVEDGRRKEGFRREGEIEQILNFKISITHERRQFVLKGIYSLFIAIMVSVVQWQIFQQLLMGKTL